jgi:hypothetical protein
MVFHGYLDIKGLEYEPRLPQDHLGNPSKNRSPGILQFLSAWSHVGLQIKTHAEFTEISTKQQVGGGFPYPNYMQTSRFENTVQWR